MRSGVFFVSRVIAKFYIVCSTVETVIVGLCRFGNSAVGRHSEVVGTILMIVSVLRTMRTAQSGVFTVGASVPELQASVTLEEG